MSEKQVKSLKNPELLTKFEVGQIVNIPRRIAYAHTSKMGVLPRPALGRVLSLGPRQVGKHYRFAVDIRFIWGTVEVWEEWQLEDIHASTPDQIQRAADHLYLKGEPEHKSPALLGKCSAAVSETNG